jgi:hypothetical protein
MPCRITPHQEKLWRERQATEQRQQERSRDRQREQQTRDNERLARLEKQWAQFGQQVRQAQREQQREAYFQDLQRMVDDLTRTVNPPPPVEQPYMPPSEGTGRLGFSDFNPALMAQPLSWW